MTQQRSWPVETAPVGPVAMGTAIARRGGSLRVTVVVKASFKLVPGGIMTRVAAPPEIRDHEAHHAENPMRSVRAASDMMPFLELADVLFVGSAYAPGGAPAPAVDVRLAVVRGSWALLDKALIVYGDRASPDGEPKPFQRMPLVYERAYGGIGLGDNPLGVAVPNVVYPDPARHAEPAGFGPISWYWPARKRLLRGHPRQLLEQRVAEVPDDFDVSFFQAAPEDQRIPYLHGDEIIVLEGLNPQHAAFETRLPGARALARVYTGGGMGKPFPLNADTLFIDGDAGQCSVTWRGSFVVSGEDALASLSVAGGIEIGPGAAIEWPEHARSGAPSTRTAPPRPPEPWGNAQQLETVVITDEDATLQKPTKIVPPFVDESTPEELVGPGATAPLRAAAPLDGTLVLSDQAADAAASAPAAPFRKGPPPLPPRATPGGARPPPLPSSSGPRKVPDGTLTLADEEAAAPKPVAAPFRITEAGGAPRSPAAPIPGAPWAGIRPPPVPRPLIRSDALPLEDEDRTLSQVIPVAPLEPPVMVDDSELVTVKRPATPRPAPRELAPEPPAPPELAPEPPKPAPPKAAEPAKEEKPAWSWAEPPPPAPARPPPPPPTKPAPKPALKNQIYGSFGESKKK